MPESLKGTIRASDLLIRAGRSVEACHELRKIQHRKIPRALALEAASVARRASLPELSVRILHPIVRPQDKRTVTATTLEKAEYAASLSYIGASEEAISLFRTLNAEDNPSILLLHAFALFSQWNYAEAIPLLDRYLVCRGLTDYQRLVGRVNLASAFLSEKDFESAEQLLKSLLPSLNDTSMSLLRGNVLEMLASCEVLQRKFEDAEQYLSEAHALLKSASGLYLIFVRKWEAILFLFRHGPTREGLARVENIRREASEHQHWESLRDCDLYQAVADQDERLATHLYVGTPFPSYRRKILAEFPRLQLPNTYRWKLKPGRSEPIDLATGGVAQGRKALKEGQSVHRLFASFCTDFYRPFRLPTLFSHLYPGEFYDPLSSGPRVFRVIERLRAWFQGERIPIAVDERRGFYRLQGTAPVSLLVRSEAKFRSRPDALVGDLRRICEGVEFTATHARDSLGVSLRTALRLLDHASSLGETEKLGAGPTTRYRFKKVSNK